MARDAFGRDLQALGNFPLPAEKKVPGLIILDVNLKIYAHRRQPGVDLVQPDIIGNRLSVIHVHGADPEGK